MTQPNDPKKGTPPTESGLQILLDNGMVDSVRDLIEIWQLKLKVVQKEEKFFLEDCIVGAEKWLKRFVTVDDETLAMLNDARKLSNIDDEVLITGETGTGKEIIARAMIGDRTGTFVAVNCAGLPEYLIESELFGHKVGAFTGAATSKKGLMAIAVNGVLFLDEIGELPITVQAKLLRALQEKVIRPVGSNDEQEINCRFVCATHRDLKKMVSENTFRQDLYARISTFELHIKPLEERRKDIEPIALTIGERLKMPSIKVKEFIEKHNDGSLDLSLNVRSIEQALKRYNILGKINSKIK